MPAKPTYVVQTLKKVRGGHLMPGGREAAPTESGAVKKAQAMAQRYTSTSLAGAQAAVRAALGHRSARRHGAGRLCGARSERWPAGVARGRNRPVGGHPLPPRQNASPTTLSLTRLAGDIALSLPKLRAEA